jgi:hypothetical protein
VPTPQKENFVKMTFNGVRHWYLEINGAVRNTNWELGLIKIKIKMQENLTSKITVRLYQIELFHI